MTRRTLIHALLAIGCFIATVSIFPEIGIAQADKVKAAIADLKAMSETLGVPKLQGSDLYFGNDRADNSIVESVVNKDGGVATLFAKNGDQYVRVATTIKKEDGTSAVGTPLDPKSPAYAKLNAGQSYYGDATIFGKAYTAAYEPIKDISGTVIGAYFVGQQKS
jgi:hypothetical protein